MPIYDYVCSACSTRTEFIHGIDAPAPRFCPACGAEDTLRKAFVPPAVHFKGSGWAKKDRSSSSRAKSKAGAGTSGESTGGSAEAASGSEAGDKPVKADASSGAATSKAGGEG